LKLTDFLKKLSKEEAIRKGKICPYCGKPTVYTNSSVVYGVSYLGNIYWCQPCDAYVGVHKGTNQALGRLANKELREAKKLAHFYFDQIARTHLINDIWREEVKMNSRNKAYLWLSKQLGMLMEHCHIGMFDVEDCLRVVSVCKALNHPGIIDPPEGGYNVTNPKPRIGPHATKPMPPSIDLSGIDFDKLMARKMAEEKERMLFAVEQITKLGYGITSINDSEIQFYFRESMVKFFPYKGWHTGRTIKDGRGIHNLLEQIREPEFKKTNKDENHITS
jgi:hypothetical protein